MDRGDRVGCAALRDHVARATFASAALGGDTEFELHFVECHAGPRMARDFTVRDSAAYTNDHGGEAAVAGWLKKPDYKYESIAFAITMRTGDFESPNAP